MKYIYNAVKFGAAITIFATLLIVVTEQIITNSPL